MRNTLLVVLIIIAAIFPFAATGFELSGGGDLKALIALGVLTVIAIAITVAAMMYRPKRTADADTPVQAIPTVKSANSRREAPAPTAPNTDNATKPANLNAPTKATPAKPDPKRQRAR